MIMSAYFLKMDLHLISIKESSLLCSKMNKVFLLVYPDFCLFIATV
jgi:hypothetical protein